MSKVSVILPVYNAEKEIEKTIKSLLKQTYKDFKIIIINDHSTDKTEIICKKYQEKYSEIIFYYENLKDKKGVSSARNYGISKSNSDYIMFIDSDDRYNSKMIEKMIQSINENDLVVCGYKLIGLNKKIDICTGKNESIKNIEKFPYIIEELQKNDLFNLPWNKIFKREIITKNNILFNENISLGEDYRFCIDYIEHTNKIKIINEILYIYNRTETGLASRYKEDNLQVRLENLLYHKNFYIKNNFDISNINKNYIRTIFSGFGEIVRNNKYGESKKIIRKYNAMNLLNEDLKSIIKENKSKLLHCSIIIILCHNVCCDYFIGKIYNLLRNIKNRKDSVK